MSRTFGQWVVLNSMKWKTSFVSWLYIKIQSFPLNIWLASTEVWLCLVR